MSPQAVPQALRSSISRQKLNDGRQLQGLFSSHDERQARAFKANSTDHGGSVEKTTGAANSVGRGSSIGSVREARLFALGPGGAIVRSFETAEEE